jgi:hypothetical protein
MATLSTTNDAFKPTVESITKQQEIDMIKTKPTNQLSSSFDLCRSTVLHHYDCCSSNGKKNRTDDVNAPLVFVFAHHYISFEGTIVAHEETIPDKNSSSKTNKKSTRISYKQSQTVSAAYPPNCVALFALMSALINVIVVNSAPINYVYFT